MFTSEMVCCWTMPRAIKSNSSNRLTRERKILFTNIVKNVTAWLLIGTFCLAQSYAQSDQQRAINGSSEAPLKIDFYFSYACPHCLDLISETQDAVDEAVKSNALQIRYYEIPTFFSPSTKDYLEHSDQAKERSTFLSTIMQCFIDVGRPDGFGRAHVAIPALLKQVVGSTRTLPPAGVPDEYTDWQYWVWADQISNMTAQVLQPVINTAGVDISACDHQAVSEVFQARYQHLPVQTGKLGPNIPQMKINGEWVPEGNGNVPRLKTLLSHSSKISEIIDAEIAFDAMHISKSPVFTGEKVERANSLTGSVVINSGNETYHISFRPDETEIRNKQVVVNEFAPAPLLSFLFFGWGASEISVIADAPDSGVWDVVGLTDVNGNALLVEMNAGQIRAFSYQPNDDNGFSFAMRSD